MTLNRKCSLIRTEEVVEQRSPVVTRVADEEEAALRSHQQPLLSIFLSTSLFVLSSVVPSGLPYPPPLESRGLQSRL